MITIPMRLLTDRQLRKIKLDFQGRIKYVKYMIYEICKEDIEALKSYVSLLNNLLTSLKKAIINDEEANR